MSTNVTHAENVSENSFQPIAPPSALSAADIASCAPAGQDHADADGRRVYAVARQDGVQSTGPRAPQNPDAARVLYLAPDGSLAAELQFDVIEGEFDEIPRSVVVRPSDDRVDEPSDAVVERFGDALEHHYEGGR